MDRSLLAAETDPDGPTPLLVGIIDLAHRLGATVVAEGVETPVQLAAALAAGCDAIQGFLWGMPASAAHCHELIGHEEALVLARRDDRRVEHAAAAPQDGRL